MFAVFVSVCLWAARIGKGKSQWGFWEAVFSLPVYLIYRLLLMMSTMGTASVGSCAEVTMVTVE